MSDSDLFEDGFLVEDDLSDEYADVDGIGDDVPAETHTRVRRAGHRKQIRVRPMSPEQMQRYPDTRSVLITKTDGRQLCLVRKD